MDYNNYEYIELHGYKNVFRREHKSMVNPHVAVSVLHPILVPFVDALIEKRPKWKFVATNRAGTVRLDDGTTVFSYSFLKVYENNETIGEIDYSYTYRKDESQTSYAYDNERLAAKRQRGSWTKTTKLDKAVKDVLKAFRPKDTTEIVRERMKIVGGTVSHTVQMETRNFTFQYGKLSDQIPNFVMANWEMLSPMMLEAGLQFDPTLPELYETAQTAKAMGASIGQDGGGLSIIVRPNDYLVVRTSGDVEIKTSEELPPEVRRKLGMLKLTEVKQYIPDMGIRCAEDTYFITGKDMM
jgi:hypothetical protein